MPGISPSSFVFSLFFILSVTSLSSSTTVQRKLISPPPSSILVEHISSIYDHQANDASESLSKSSSSSPPPPPPILIWHGLGDNYDSSGMKSIVDLLEDILSHNHTHDHTSTDANIESERPQLLSSPPTIYSINLTTSSSGDRFAGYIGHVPTQISTVCHAIAAHPALSTAPLIHIIGFSQGGLFARGLIQTCEKLPRVGVLMTFGSPHMGIGDLGGCDDGGKRKGDVEDDDGEFFGVDNDDDVNDEILEQKGFWGCEAMLNYAKRNVWGDGVQRKVVPAQYFRSVHLLGRESGSNGENDFISVPDGKYLEHSGWLADINCERRPIGEGGKDLQLYDIQQQQQLLLQQQRQQQPLRQNYPKDSSSSTKTEEEERRLSTGYYHNSTFHRHLTRMDRFVMIRFADENLIIPPATTWFGQGGAMEKDKDEDKEEDEHCRDQNNNNNIDSVVVNKNNNNNNNDNVGLDDDNDDGSKNDNDNDNDNWSLPLTAWQGYKQDWLGLRTLDEEGKLTFETVAGEHMHFSDEAFGGLVRAYLSGYY